MSGEWKDKAAHGSYLDSILHYGPDLAAGSPQEARSEACPTSLTGEEGSAAREALGRRYRLGVGVVDLSGIPDDLRYGGGGGYSTALDRVLEGGWGFVCSHAGASEAGMIVVARLEVAS